MGDAARLGWYAVVEALTLLRWLVATVLSILGVARVDGVFAALRGNADRQRDWASDRLGRRLVAEYEPTRPPSRSKGLAPLGAQLEDRAKARDLDWHLVNPVATAIGLVPPALLAWFGLTMAIAPIPLIFYNFYNGFDSYWPARCWRRRRRTPRRRSASSGRWCGASGRRCSRTAAWSRRCARSQRPAPSRRGSCPRWRVG